MLNLSELDVVRSNMFVLFCFVLFCFVSWVLFCLLIWIFSDGIHGKTSPTDLKSKGDYHSKPFPRSGSGNAILDYANNIPTTVSEDERRPQDDLSRSVTRLV